VRTIADQLATLAGRASSESAARADMRKALAEAIAQLRFAAQGEAESPASCTNGGARLRAYWRPSRPFLPVPARHLASRWRTS
jgi:hypothetical protein